jgi:hypothetical protein
METAKERSPVEGELLAAARQGDAVAFERLDGGMSAR